MCWRGIAEAGGFEAAGLPGIGVGRRRFHESSAWGGSVVGMAMVCRD